MKKLIISAILTSASLTAQIPLDKKLHFGAGYIVSATTYKAVYKVTKSKNKAIIWSTVSTLLVGLGKEILDAKKANNRFDINDALYTSAGGALATITINF